MTLPTYQPDDDVTAAVKGFPLYYHSSARDIEEPVRLCTPWITDFWFCDLGYFTTTPMSASPPALRHKDFQFIEMECRGPETSAVTERTDEDTGMPYPWIEPGLRIDRYRHRPTESIVRIHRRRGYGVSGLRAEIPRLGIFLFRGNGLGEGNSTAWFGGAPWRLVLDRLIDGGLIITDGSSHNDGRTEPLARFYNDSHIGAKAAEQVEDFDAYDRTFLCIGYVGERYGPCLVWRVHRKSPPHCND